MKNIHVRFSLKTKVLTVHTTIFLLFSNKTSTSGHSLFRIFPTVSWPGWFQLQRVCLISSWCSVTSYRFSWPLLYVFWSTSLSISFYMHEPVTSISILPSFHLNFNYHSASNVVAWYSYTESVNRYSVNSGFVDSCLISGVGDLMC